MIFVRGFCHLPKRNPTIFLNDGSGHFQGYYMYSNDLHVRNHVQTFLKKKHINFFYSSWSTAYSLSHHINLTNHPHRPSWVCFCFYLGRLLHKQENKRKTTFQGTNISHQTGSSVDIIDSKIRRER